MDGWMDGVVGTLDENFVMPVTEVTKLSMSLLRLILGRVATLALRRSLCA